MLTFCERRKLWLRPARDCKHCAWYECEQHPKHNMWPVMQRILAKCITMRRSRPDCRGKKKAWDGKREHCARYNAMQWGRYSEDPCVNCSLDRPCKHRGESGQWLADESRKEKKPVGGLNLDGDHYITRVGKRFRVRIQIAGRQTTVGTYRTIKEARDARDAALLKSYVASADDGGRQ